MQVRAFLIKVPGGKEVDTAYQIDYYARANGIDMHVSAFEREKNEYQDPDFRKGMVGYVLILTKINLEKIWFGFSEYLKSIGYWGKILPELIIEELDKHGKFYRALIEKINDFIISNIRPELEEIVIKKKMRITFWRDLHRLLNIADEVLHAVFARWTVCLRPVSLLFDST